MKIRDACGADLPAIVDIYNAAIPARLATADTEPLTVEGRRPWFEGHRPERHPLWVADVDGGVVGWLGFQAFYGRPAYAATAEISVYVAARARRTGVGRVLLAEAVRRGPGLGLTTLLGFVFGHNAPSLALFQSFGFEQWGRLPCVAVLDGVERDLVIVGRRIAEKAG
ncbi:MAG: GNAT family N-acetyltransferase [Candidatus Rokuibacteriota bacterium]